MSNKSFGMNMFGNDFKSGDSSLTGLNLSDYKINNQQGLAKTDANIMSSLGAPVKKLAGLGLKAVTGAAALKTVAVGAAVVGAVAVGATAGYLINKHVPGVKEGATKLFEGAINGVKKVSDYVFNNGKNTDSPAALKERAESKENPSDEKLQAPTEKINQINSAVSGKDAPPSPEINSSVAAPEISPEKNLDRSMPTPTAEKGGKEKSIEPENGV